MLEKVRTALRIKTRSLDNEIEDLIAAALADLKIADENDPLIIRAVITYCKANFGVTDAYDRLKKSYDEQKAQLQMASGFTDWGDE